MAEEQDVFISGISGSIQQWSTEATATKMEQTLMKINASSSAMTQLLSAIKNGEGVSQKQMARAVNATKNTTKATNQASKKESQDNSRTHGLLNQMQSSFKEGWSSSSNGVIDQLRKDQAIATRLEKDTQRLMQAGMGRDDAVKTLRTEKRAEKQMNFFKAAAAGIITLAAGAEEAIKAGFDQRFDMASELRQSGLMNGLGAVNDGMISIAQTISETGFTFGQAAEFTKQFSQAVGVKGVKATLDFVNNMARGPNGLMEQFSMEFGQVAHMSGEYMDSLRISGQLSRMSDAQLKVGLGSFMSNVQATSNVLKVSMEQAATILKGSLDDNSRGMLLTLPEQMQSSIKSGMEMMGGMQNPLAELITARLGAGENNFMQTSQFQEMAGTMAGQKMIGFSQEAATVLETQGDAAFQSFMSNEGEAFIGNLIATMSDGANRTVAIADGTMPMIAKIAQFMQTLNQMDKGIGGGDEADNAAMLFADQQVQSQVSSEGAMTTLMPGFIENVRDLTATNRRFAEQAATTIRTNANVIDGMANAATQFKQTVTGLGTVLLKIVNIPGSVVDFATNNILGLGGVYSNDTRDITDFTSNKDGGVRSMNDSQALKFENYTKDMIKTLRNNDSMDAEEKRAAAATLQATLESVINNTKVADGASASVGHTQDRILSSLNQLLIELRQ